MKTLNTLVLVVITVIASHAGDSKYFESMSKSINAIYSAATSEELQNAINALDRIGGAEKTKWEPYYYASFGYVNMALREKEAGKKDAYLDLATEEIKKASALVSNESEIVTMEGFIYMIRTSVDPMSRGQRFSGLAMQSFNKAIELNPENPRAYAMLAQMQFGIAKFFNSGTDEACATTRKSIEKFASFKPQSPVTPMWGKESSQELLSQCL